MATGLAAYSSSFSGLFHMDDVQNIVRNPRIREIHRLDRIATGTFRPVADLTLAANYAAGRLDVRGYHAVNLSIHLLAALVLFGLLRRTLCTVRLHARYSARSNELALAVALLWTLHPLQTEAVTYLIQRCESLMALFYLLTLYGLLNSVQQPSWGALAVASCALGMGTKPVMATAPIVALLYDRVFLSGSWRETVRQRWKLHTGLCATWLILALLLASNVKEFREHVGLGEKLATPLRYALSQPGVLLHYLRLTVWPHPLILDYGWPVAQTARQIVPPALAVGTLLLVALRRWREPAGFLGTAFFLVLAPTSTVLPIADLAFEHRMYLPLAAVLTLLVLGLARILSARGLWAAAAALALLFSALTIRRNADYRDEVALWGGVLAHRPENVRARSGLAIALYKRGRAREAEEQFREVIRRQGSFPGAHDNLGLTLQAQGRPEEAYREYALALRVKPDEAITHNNIGALLFQAGQVEEAAAWFRRAAELDPQYADAYGNLGAVCLTRGDLRQAVALYRRAVELDPNDGGLRQVLLRAERDLST